jgi:hypothetical protein
MSAKLVSLQTQPAFEREDRWKAIRTRDHHYDGAFVFAVRSTGIYCRPSCPSRRPRPEQVVFFPAPDAAEREGFSPCRRCRPRTGARHPRAELIKRLCRLIETRVAAYLDERADDRQAAALGAIFTGAEGGPMAAFAPLIGQQLGVKKVPIRYIVQGKNRSVEIPGILQMGVAPLPTMHASGEIWAAIGHPVAPDRLALAVGTGGSSYTDYGMRWDNSGRNGHYAPISWSN